MSRLHDFPHRGRSVGRMAAMCLLAALATGCVRPLAVHDEFFFPLNGTAAGIEERTRYAVAHQRALQAARRGCSAAARVSASGGTDPAEGPAFGPAAAREALAELCDVPARPPVAAYGATSNAYGSWVEKAGKGELRDKLPKQGGIAAGAAGGS